MSPICSTEGCSELCSSVLGENLEDHPQPEEPRPPRTGISTFCSTNCGAVELCPGGNLEGNWNVNSLLEKQPRHDNQHVRWHFHQRRQEPREGRDGQEILGTAINCLGIAASKSRNTSTCWSTICGTGTSRMCTKGQTSTRCSTVCSCTRCCGRGSAKAPGTQQPHNEDEQRFMFPKP